MAHMRWAVIALQQADRFVTGGEQNLELALTAHIVPELELEILRQTGPADATTMSNDVSYASRPAPSLGALLDIAREIIRHDLSTVLDGDARYKVLMASNALSIVSRQIEALDVSDENTDMISALASKVRNGDGSPEDHALLLAGVVETLRLSNPRALK